MTRSRLLLLAALLGGAAIAGPALAQDVPKGDAAAGKNVFLTDGCYECHGRVGEGGAMNGPAPILAKTKLPFEAFKGQLRNPSNDMPPYPDTLLSDQQVADIFAYLQSLPGPRPVSDLPILND
ncbi:MAG TPA: cytochrome c [Stellaceae bacterium]|jgi:mono/diheme cytochrome c family protein|nr:cytochrome c [Stellaceae bacterium]